MIIPSEVTLIIYGFIACMVGGYFGLGYLIELLTKFTSTK